MSKKLDNEQKIGSLITHSQLKFFEILEIFIFLYNDRKGVLSSQNLNNIHINFGAFIERRYVLQI